MLAFILLVAIQPAPEVLPPPQEEQQTEEVPYQPLDPGFQEADQPELEPLAAELNAYPPSYEIRRRERAAEHYLDWLEQFCEINSNSPDVIQWSTVWLKEARAIHTALHALAVARLGTPVPDDQGRLDSYRAICKLLNWPENQCLPGTPYWRFPCQTKTRQPVAAVSPSFSP